jgi:hypothetical protein
MAPGERTRLGEEDAGMEAQERRGHRRVRSPRGIRPTLEAMEMRELLSVTPLIVQSARSFSPAQLQAAALSQSAAGSGVPGQTMLNPATSMTPLIGTGPSRRELARERFHAVFSGPVYVSSGRFSDQAKTLYFRGLGTSSAFLHGDFQMAIVFPADTTKPLFGEAVLQDKNNNSSGIIGLQLHGLTPQTFDRQGRPTSFTFNQDPNIYSGIFFVETSSGTLNIHYSKGSATAVFNGLVYTTGLTNPLTNSDLYARGGRITPRGGRATT